MILILLLLGADGIVMVFDTSNQASFEDIEKYWINEVESYSEKNVSLMLLGNKIDLTKEENKEKLVDSSVA